MKKIITTFTLAGLFFSAAMPVFANNTRPVEPPAVREPTPQQISEPFGTWEVLDEPVVDLEDPALAPYIEMRTEISKRLDEQYGQNTILEVALEMLKHKIYHQSYDGDYIYQFNDVTNNRWDPTILQLEIDGGVDTLDIFSSSNDTLDLLSGASAIDESLQLGSIGSNATTDSPAATTYNINELTPVEIPSHPWADMIQGSDFTVPSIAEIVPADTFFIYFSDPTKYRKLQEIMSEVSTEIDLDLYGLGNKFELEEAMLEGLGLTASSLNLEEIENIAFISTDLSFVRGTTYALVIEPKDEYDAELSEIVTPAPHTLQLQGYTVIANDQSILTQIEQAANDSTLSLAAQADFHFALSQIERRRDGIIYLSEAFIRKLTGPEYRLNARRRNTAAQALVTLQYLSFAHLEITGDFPQSFQQLITEGYIPNELLVDPSAFTIDQQGIVRHQKWGSIWDLEPINNVPITQISLAEKENYENFSAGYQNYFREFFDPVAISLTVSDQVLIHTIILPLIDNSDYRFIKAGFSPQSPYPLRSIFEARRLGALNIAGQFSLEKLLISEAPGENGDEPTPQEVEQYLDEIEQDILEELDLEKVNGKRVWDFVGDELSFSVGAENNFQIENIADLDLWLTLEINDQKAAENFINKFYASFASETSEFGAGPFSVSSSTPLKNNYNGVDYFVIPTGFVNAYYTFLDDRIYVSVSQLSINRIIDQYQGVGFADFKRPLAFIGRNHHLMGIADLSALAQWNADDLASRENNEWYLQQEAEDYLAYYNEASTLGKNLSDDGQALEAAREYYQHLPADFRGAKFSINDGELYLSGQGNSAPITGIDFSSPYYRAPDTDNPKEPLSSFVPKSDAAEKIKNILKRYENAALGMSFTEDGLDVRVTFNNPNISKADSRFAISQTIELPKKSKFFSTTSHPILYIVPIMAIIAMLGIIFWNIKKR